MAYPVVTWYDYAVKNDIDTWKYSGGIYYMLLDFGDGELKAGILAHAMEAMQKSQTKEAIKIWNGCSII